MADTQKKMSKKGVESCTSSMPYDVNIPKNGQKVQKVSALGGHRKQKKEESNKRLNIAKNEKANLH